MNTMLTRRNVISGLGAAAAARTLLADQRTTAQPQTSSPGREPVNTGSIVKLYEFSSGSGGLLAGFADYNLGLEPMNFVAETRRLPGGLGAGWGNRNAYYLAGDNRSDSLFMFLKAPFTRLDGIESSAAYRVSFDIQFASRSNNCWGVGGSEDAVYLKAGGSTLEPVALLTNAENENFVGINVDKGAERQGGRDLGFVDTVWNGLECPVSRWVMLRRTYTHAFPIVSTRNEQLWVAFGTESAYEAVTEIYYHWIRVKLTRW